LKNSDTSRRLWRFGTTLLLLVIPALPAFARTFHNEAWAREKFSAAEKLGQTLNEKDSSARSQRDYQRVIDAYRRVYYGSPTSSKADVSVFAVAELMAEMGRQFDDKNILRSAVRQYEFLRREYPGSRYRFEALFAMGNVYRDLGDPAAARSTLEAFLHRYPRNHLAGDAKTALAQLDQKTTETVAKKAAGKKDATSNPDIEQAKPSDSDAEENAAKDSDPSPAVKPAETPGKFSRVTGIRHWSTADYARVAIDMEQEVPFDSHKLPDPNRIFFDLHDAQLAASLAGKNLNVNDGFLKKIRVAQFRRGRARVVLELEDSSNYAAFFAQNPPRLIIEIRGNNYAKSAESKDETQTADASGVNQSTPNPAVDNNESPATTVSQNSSKAVPKVAVATEASKSFPKKIVVEADDDDNRAAANARPEPAPTSKSRKSPSAVATASRKGPHPDRAASSRHTKHRSADGNNDEVATLQPPDAADTPDAPARVAVERSKIASNKTTTTKNGKRGDPDPIVREATPTASGDRSLIRALGLKIGRIVIDPGHGGHDTGTIGPNGLEEKKLVLDVAKKLGKLLEARLGAEVVYTRQDDTFIPLETRTSIANQEQADLFVSIHANSSHDPDARGVETYYLNFTSNTDALEVAARENAVSDKSIHELQDLVKKIALKDKIEESREFASDVQRSLHSGLSVKNPGIRDRGVKKAPFIVLIGANMPSILAEISFVSNPTDARKLETTEYRQRIAESLYKGISKYVGGLSGVKVAAKISKDEGQ